MRVYEIAKELGVPSKDLVTFLNDAGFNVASHMSILPAGAEESARKKFGKKTEAQQSSPSKKDLDAPATTRQQHRHEPVKHTTQHVSSKEVPVHTTSATPIIAEESVKKEPVVSVRFRDDSVKDALVSSGVLPEELDLQDRPVSQERISRFLIKKSFGFGDGFGARPRRRSRKRRPRPIFEEVKTPVTEIKIDKSLPLFEVADLLGKNSGELILALLKKGMICNRNHILATDVIKNLADQFGVKSSLAVSSKPAEKELISERESKGVSREVARWPIVVVMGHVDHGKTTLLDYIRKMNVAATEKGGITQHLGAYEVNSAHGKIVFLDTPGHEAFSYIRERGSRVTDLVVLVVAVDDGVKPQTIEAINHAKVADVPIIVAINKIDKAQSPAALETVKRQLAQYDLMSEDWGGKTVMVPISAKTGKGVDELLELIVLQSQLMELKADPTVPAKAFVLESKIEKGFGPVATVIAVEGMLKQGDYFTCGSSVGKIRLLINSFGKKIPTAAPSVPVLVVGFDSFASIGDWLRVVPQEVYLKAKSSGLSDQTTALDVASPGTLQNVDTSEKARVLNLIIKTDTRGSKEALMGCIEKLTKLGKEVKCPLYVISTGVGDITENDIEFADSTNAVIVGLHVKTEKNALILAKQKNVTMMQHHIIYHLVEELEKLLQSKRIAEIVWAKVGEAIVKRVFDIKGVGVIAGCYMRDGVLSRDCKVTCVRDGKVIGEGKITSLQRDKKTVKEIHAGYECGFVTDSFSDWQEGDTVLCYAQVKEKKQQ